MNGAESDEESSAVTGFFRPVLEWMKIPQQDWSHLIRKTAHFTEFFIMGLILSAVCREKNILLPLLTALLIACTDETIQLFVPGRSAEFADVLLDTLGAAYAIFLFYAAVFLLNKHKHNSIEKRNEKK